MQAKITKAQITKIQTILQKKGFDKDARADLIANFTEGRTESVKELTKLEAARLIKSLDEQKRKDETKQRTALFKCIYALGFEVSLLNKNVKGRPEEKDDREINIYKINRFATNKMQKSTDEMTLEELKKFRRMLEAVAKKEQEKDG
jgi:hypothetical protein